MIIRLSAVHEDPRITPLPFKEVLGVVDGVSGADALRRREVSARERRLKSRMQSVKEAVKMRKRC